MSKTNTPQHLVDEAIKTLARLFPGRDIVLLIGETERHFAVLSTNCDEAGALAMLASARAVIADPEAVNIKDSRRTNVDEGLQ